MSSAERSEETPDLPPDNATRIAIFDVMHDARTEGHDSLTVDELRERVLPRLRILVPRELHVAGDVLYVNEKVKACIDDRILVLRGDERLGLTDLMPRVRYPNDEIRDYTPGLEPARERLDADNARLREAHFDVRDHIPSTTQYPEAFEALVQSMREHGYLKHFPLVELADGSVLDGRARRAAAAQAGVEIKRYEWPSPRDRDFARRRDTPLSRLLLVRDQNASRLRRDDRESVLQTVAKLTGREWSDVASDLQRTHPWRSTTSRGYRPVFASRLERFRPDGQPRVHVTKTGDKVMVRSLIQAAGLAPYRLNWIKAYVPLERGKSDLPGAGPGADFAPASVLLEGIENMLKDRRKTKAKIDLEWLEICDWLRSTFSLEGTSLPPIVVEG